MPKKSIFDGPGRDVIKKARERKQAQDNYDTLSRRGLSQRKPALLITGGDNRISSPGGAAQPSPYKYTGKGAAKGAKRLKKAPVKSASRKSKITKSKY